MNTLIESIKNNTYNSNKLKFRNDNIIKLCEALKINFSITSLDLSHNNIYA